MVPATTVSVSADDSRKIGRQNALEVRSMLLSLPLLPPSAATL
jgi:hypothetical protein